MARPRSVLPDNAEVVIAGMAFAGAKTRDIAAAMGTSERTIKRHFGPILTKQRALRRIALLQWQMNAAKKGNPAILIWLGKQELGQQDVVEYAPLDVSKMSDEELQAIASGKGRPHLRLHR